MRKILEWVIQRTWRIALCALVIGVIAGALVRLWDWWSYYDTMSVIAANQGEEYASHLAALYEGEADPASSRDRIARKASAMIRNMRGGITVTDASGVLASAPPPDKDSRGRSLGEEDLHDREYELGSFNPNASGVKLRIVSRRPPTYWEALAKGAPLTSLFELGPTTWWGRRHYKAALPFWLPLIITGITAFLLLVYTSRVSRHATAVRHRQRAQLDRALKAFRAQLDRKRDALRDTEEELATREVELQAAQAGEEEDLADIESDHLQLKRERDQLRSDVDIALQMAEKREDLLRELNTDEAKQERKAGRLVLGKTKDLAVIEKWLEELESAPARPAASVAKDPRFTRLCRHLRGWLKRRHDGPEERWRPHHGRVEAEGTYNKIESEFLRQYIAHASNGPFDPAHLRTISVRAPGDGAPLPGLVIAFEDGVTLHLDYEPRRKKGIPDAQRIGFALAVVLRAVHKDFEAFRIR